VGDAAPCAWRRGCYWRWNLALLAILAFHAEDGGRAGRGCPMDGLFFAVTISVWLLVTSFNLVDVQAGDRSIMPTNSVDYSIRAR